MMLSLTCDVIGQECKFLPFLYCRLMVLQTDVTIVKAGSLGMNGCMLAGI